MTTIFCCRL